MPRKDGSGEWKGREERSGLLEDEREKRRGRGGRTRTSCFIDLISKLN